MKIKFNLVKLEKALIFQITDQIDLTGVYWDSRDFPHHESSKLLKNRIRIMSNCYPDISVCLTEPMVWGVWIEMDKYLDIIINLRGTDRNRDDDIVIEKFDTNEKRDLIYDIIIEAMNHCFDKG